LPTLKFSRHRRALPCRAQRADLVRYLPGGPARWGASAGGSPTGCWAALIRRRWSTLPLRSHWRGWAMIMG
jgi:hypothetical protein